MVTAGAKNRWRVLLLASIPAVAFVCLLLYGPIRQSEVLPRYHDFADQRTLWGLPNFWNVVSNLPFLLVAVWGLRAFRSPAAFTETWERTAYGVILVGLALIAAGSAYYHWRPDDARLVWDRLPMAVVFMALLATTAGERIRAPGAGLLMSALLAVGVISVLYWKFTDDLRLYAFVQFSAVLGLPLLVFLFPPRYSGTAGILAMVALYGLALAFDRYDRQLAAISETGGHPAKHLAAALAMLFYVRTIEYRRPLAAFSIPAPA